MRGSRQAGAAARSSMPRAQQQGTSLDGGTAGEGAEGVWGVYMPGSLYIIGGHYNSVFDILKRTICKVKEHGSMKQYSVLLFSKRKEIILLWK